MNPCAEGCDCMFCMIDDFHRGCSVCVHQRKKSITIAEAEELYPEAMTLLDFQAHEFATHSTMTIMTKTAGFSINVNGLRVHIHRGYGDHPCCTWIPEVGIWRRTVFGITSHPRREPNEDVIVINRL